jgi:hypothetical protein
LPQPAGRTGRGADRDLATDAVDAMYAVKAKGEDLAAQAAGTWSVYRLLRMAGELLALAFGAGLDSLGV